MYTFSSSTSGKQEGEEVLKGNERRVTTGRSVDRTGGAYLMRPGDGRTILILQLPVSSHITTAVEYAQIMVLSTLGSDPPDEPEGYLLHLHG